LTTADTDWCFDVCVDGSVEGYGDVSWSMKRQRRDAERLDVKRRSHAPAIVPRERLILAVNLALKKQSPSRAN